MIRTTLMLLFLVGCCWSCDHLPLADERARPEPPALPAEVLQGDPFVMLTAKKMNVVYVGIPNPLDLHSTGVNLNDLRVMASPPGYITEYEKSYLLNLAAPGLQTVKVRLNGKLLNEFTFRAKRLPDPVAKLANKPSGKMSVGEFKAQSGMIASLDNFDFDVKCFIAGFEVTRIPLKEGRLTETNEGGGYDDRSKKLILMATKGDIYTFTDVRAKCPGDKVSRTINSLVFEIL